MTNRILSTVFVILGAALVIIALFLTRAKISEDRAAGTYSTEAYTVVQDITEERQAVLSEVQTVPDYIIDPDLPMPVCEADGWSYIGTLSIPAIGKTLSVMDEWSYAGLKVNPGRYQGSAYTNDLIICGHNYQSHFGQLKSLEVGDEVSFTDMDGNEFHYSVSAVETLDGTDIDEMPAGDWDLTLFTCTLGGQQRVTIRCDLSENTEGGESL